jgi:hypothetical protein
MTSEDADDYAWALDRVTRMCAANEVNAQVYGVKLLKGQGYPNETFSYAQDYQALSIVLSALQQADQERDQLRAELAAAREACPVSRMDRFADASLLAVVNEQVFQLFRRMQSRAPEDR